MANTLRFKRGLVSTIPTALAGEPLFTTDTFDLYIGNGTTNTRFQKYIASGATTQILRGDGSLYTFPLAISSPSAGQVLKYNGTSWVNDSDAGITGSLTTNYLPKATGATTLGNSLVYDAGTGVGINTTSVIAGLDVRLAVSNLSAYFLNSGSDFKVVNSSSGLSIGTSVGNPFVFLSSDIEAMRITPLRNLHIGTFSSDSGEKLQVTGTMKVTGAATTNTYFQAVAGGRDFYFNPSADFGNGQKPTIQVASNHDLQFATNNTLRATLDASGNLGLSVTPSAWGANFKSLQLNGGSLFNYLTSEIHIGQNLYYSTSSTANYVNNGFASDYWQYNGQHIWQTAPSGTAGNAITFTQAMTLTNTSRLLLNSTSDTGQQLQVTGTAKITGATTIGGDLYVYTDQLFVDATNNKVQVGTIASMPFKFSSFSTSSHTIGILNSSIGTVGQHVGVTFGFGATYNKGALYFISRDGNGRGDLHFALNNAASSANVSTSDARMILNYEGNLGLGVTPSAWTDYKVLQNVGGSLIGAIGELQLFQNAYYDGASKYYATGTATRYSMSGGLHRWLNAVSGSANAAITWSTPMTLTANGRLLLGTTTEGTQRLQVAGDAYLSDTLRVDGLMAQGGAAASDINFWMRKSLSGSVYPSGIYMSSVVSSTSTNGATYFTSDATTQAASFTVPRLEHFKARQTTFGAGSSVTNQYGFFVESTLNGATNNYGFWGDITSGTGRWNLYMNGTAANYLAGSLGIGTTSPTSRLDVIQSGGTAGISVSGGTNPQLRATDGTIAAKVQAITGLAAYIGTETNHQLRLIVNNSPLVYLFTSTNVSVGSSSDSGEKLQVNGTMKVTGASTFGGNMDLISGGNAVFTLDAGSVNTSALIFKGSGTERGRISFASTNNMKFSIGSGVNQYLEIDATTRAATFSSSVTAASLNVTGAITFAANVWNTSGGNNRFYFDSSNTYFGSPNFWNFQNNSGSNVVSINSTGAATFSSSVTAASGIFNGFVGVNGSPATSFPLEAYINSSTAYTTSSRGNVFRVYNTNTGANIYAGIELGGTGTGNDGLAGINAIVTGSGSAALSFYTRDSATISEKMRITSGGDVGIGMTPSYKLDVTGSARVSDAIAIGTTPDTNKPFKILKNINGTVGINFENTSTGASAFSAIQMGTDVSGGTKFTNLVYSSSGVTASGVYQPDGTSLINNGSGGLNFLGTPIRFYTGASNGVLRLYFDNEGTTQLNATSPTTSITDGYRQYSADVVAGNAAPHFRTENGAIIKLYQETTAVGNSTISVGGGNAVLDDTEFGGYTLRQVVQALKNQGILA